MTLSGDDRGQSTLLAVVLMMGFVAAASVSLLVVGTATITESKDSMQEHQVENTFREFNKDISSVAFGRQKYRTMQFDVQDQTAAFRQEDTGRIKVSVDGSVIVDESVGSLVYESDSKTMAYQAGGVWKGTGKESRMVSKPPVEYQNGSLTFPIAALGGDESVQAGELGLKKKKTESPINNVGYVQGKLVTLEITSEYYMGWAQYFREQTNDVAVEVDHSPTGPEGTVTVKLGQPVANGNFEDGVMATGGDDGDVVFGGGSAQVDGPVAATGDIHADDDDITGEERPNQESNLFELDEAINRKVNDAESNASIIDVDLESGGTLENGNTYYADDGFTLTSGEDIDVNLGDGNVTLVLDGDISLQKGDIDVDPEGTDNQFRVYTTGDFGMKNSHAGPPKSESAKHFQVYGTSDMQVAIQGGGGTQFVGTIYAPRNEPALTGSEQNDADIVQNGKCDGWDVCITTGSSNVKGAIVAGPTKFAQSAGLTYDNSLDQVKPTLELKDGVLPPPITFLKVSVHTVEVNNSNANVASAGDLGAPASIASQSSASPSGFGSVATAASSVAASPAHRWTRGDA